MYHYLFYTFNGFRASGRAVVLDQESAYWNLGVLTYRIIYSIGRMAGGDGIHHRHLYHRIGGKKNIGDHVRSRQVCGFDNGVGDAARVREAVDLIGQAVHRVRVLDYY